MNKTQAAELKQHEQERDFFCVVSDAFRVFARRSSSMLGSAWAFTAALLVIAHLASLLAPVFHFSNTWQLIINTGYDHYHLPDGVSDPEHLQTETLRQFI